MALFSIFLFSSICVLYPLTSCRHLMDISASPTGDIICCYASTALIHKPIFILINGYAAQHTYTSMKHTDDSLFKRIPESKNIIKRFIATLPVPSHLHKTILMEIQQGSSSCAASYLRVSVEVLLSSCAC